MEKQLKKLQDGAFKLDDLQMKISEQAKASGDVELGFVASAMKDELDTMHATIFELKNNLPAYNR